MTTTRCKGNTARAEILDSSVRKLGQGHRPCPNEILVSIVYEGKDLS